MHAVDPVSIATGIVVRAGTTAAHKWGARRWFRYRAKRLFRKTGTAGYGTPGFTSPWWWGHYLDQQTNGMAIAGYGTRGYAGIAPMRSLGVVKWPWLKAEEIAAAKAAEEAECSGMAALWPSCVVRRSQTQAQEAGEALSQQFYEQLWNTVRVPLIVGGVGLVAYLAVNKIQKARRSRRAV
jgi:hypothetical protein